jgi:CRISPR/Cas system CSM-associated protein Csm2 small subunit
VYKWEVNTDYNGSDHNTITFCIANITETIPKRRNWEKADWKEFSNALDKKALQFPEVITDKKLDIQCEKLYSVINKALDKVCPMKKEFKRGKNNPWYGEELMELRRRTTEISKVEKEKITT